MSCAQTTQGRLVAIDWGSTSLRAFLLGEGGQVLAQARSAAGASVLAGGPAGFEAALRALIGGWLHAQPGLPMLACGMVGSAHGWREAPYADCPAGMPQWAAHAVAVPFAGGELKILPGLRCQAAGGSPDVMRGEETQVGGALALRPELAGGATIVLPGTHSKWVQVRGGRVTGFATRMTGELHAVLRQHSVLGRLMPPVAGDAFDAEAFDAGVDAARRGKGRDLLHQLFAVRTLGLFGQRAAEGLADHLSGLLIGHELVAGLADADADAELPLVLVGEVALCARYEHGLRRLGRDAGLRLDNTAPAGLWQTALQAGWLA